MELKLIQLIVYNGDCLISPFLHLAVLRVFRIQSILVIFFAIAPLLLNIGLLGNYAGCLWLVDGFAQCYF